MTLDQSTLFDTEPERPTQDSAEMDIEQIGFDFANLGFFFDLRRVLSDRTTMAAKWECRLQPFIAFDSAWPYGEGKTAKEAIAKAKSKLPKLLFTEDIA